MPDPIIANVPTALDDLVDAIRAAGVACTRNPEELQPPAAIVAAPTFVGATHGALAVTVPVYFVVADLGQRAVDQSLAMLANALPVLGTRNANPTLWVTPLNPQGLPAMMVSVQMTIEGA
jgi:DNA-binding IclR family transcriptional regulator